MSEDKKYPRPTHESRFEEHYFAFIKLKDVNGSDVHDTTTVWSCEELEVWVDHDVNGKPLSIEVMFKEGA